MDRPTTTRTTNPTSCPLASTAADPASSRGIRTPRRRPLAASSTRTRSYDAADEALSMPVEATFDFERLDFVVIDGSGRSLRPSLGVTTDSATGAVLGVFCELMG
ncbi:MULTISPECIES: hypothetical protein [unclassified Methylobacterium]|jgi:hypothetical protein|uniref:hypothetical protein n=1 Tax=unclassified Methylobacterium TaxID=2615210 RepID=UPI001353C46B|nr:hypothetical protein [Methylobacterium sp. 2A]MWV24678.1 hypothetical protein [Methylobacterium sp. 2A]